MRSKLVRIGNLVFVKRKQVFTNSKIIAEGAGIDHKSIKKLIRKYEKRLKNKGTLEILNLESIGGRPEEIYELNEEQTMFLLTLCRNTEKVVDFKDKLSSAFFKAIELLREQQTPEYQQLRLTAKSSTKTLHDTIKEKYIPYAIESGSKTYKENPGLAYNNFEKVVNKSLQIVVKGREYLNKREQTRLDMVNNIIKCLIEDCIGKQVEYHKIVELAKTKVKQIAGLFDFEDISTQV
nr:MAG TPA: regulatory protein [Bacteriophage sp.]